MHPCARAAGGGVQSGRTSLLHFVSVVVVASLHWHALVHATAPRIAVATFVSDLNCEPLCFLRPTRLCLTGSNKMQLICLPPAACTNLVLGAGVEAQQHRPVRDCAQRVFALRLPACVQEALGAPCHGTIRPCAPAYALQICGAAWCEPELHLSALTDSCGPQHFCHCPRGLQSMHRITASAWAARLACRKPAHQHVHAQKHLGYVLAEPACVFAAQTGTISPAAGGRGVLAVWARRQ